MRGIQIQCGYTTYWPNPTCYPQAEDGPSLTHTYAIPSTNTPTTTTLAWAECCPIVPDCPATPPITYPIGGPNEPSLYIQLIATTPQAIPFQVCTPVVWEEELASDSYPSISLPTIDIILPFEGLWAWTANVWYEINTSSYRTLIVHEPTETAIPYTFRIAQNVGNGTPTRVHGYTWQHRGDIQRIATSQGTATPKNLINNQARRQATLTLQLIATGTPT